ncbi:MAG: O-methyltransferase [Anaerolineales bacterium]|nr:MAG: O-methyltransferase [Anaerolineales bacterium]
MTIYNDALSTYIQDLFVPQDQALQYIQEVTPQKGLPSINIKPEEGHFLQMLVRMCGARQAVEIGTLGGYSGTWIARGLPPEGRLITLEIEPHHAQVAREHFQLAGVADRVEVRVGDAHQSLKQITPDGPFDFVFIDAEKTGYKAYFDWAVENIRLGGVITAHNIFRKGGILETDSEDAWILATQEFNREVAADARVLTTIYPAGDGTLVSIKLSN